MSFEKWETVRLGAISTKITKGTTPTTMGHPFVESGVNFVKAEAVTPNGRIDSSKFVFITDDVHEKLKRSQLEKDDILFSMAGVVLGKTALVTEEILPANTNQALALIRLDKTKADPQFVNFFLQQKSVFDFVNSMTAQSAQPNINLQEIGGLEITLPPLATQRRIAALLTALDDKIELNRRMNETLEGIAGAVWGEWFGQYAGGEELPEGWCVGKLGDCFQVVDFVANGSFAALKANVNLFDSENFALYIRTTDYKHGFLGNLKYTDKNSFEFLRKSELKGGEIIISNVGDTGTVFRPPLWLNKPMTLGSNAIMLKPNHLSEYAFYLLKGTIGQELINGIVAGSAQPKFNKTDFRALNIVLPSEPVLLKFNDVVKGIHLQINQNLQQARTLTALRDALLPRLMGGELEI